MTTEKDIINNFREEMQQAGLDYDEFENQIIQSQKQKIIEEIEKLHIVKDEICQCGHSKLCHFSHILDNHGGNCNQCKCKIYTWKEFVFIDNNEILKSLGEKDGK